MIPRWQPADLQFPDIPNTLPLQQAIRPAADSFPEAIASRSGTNARLNFQSYIYKPKLSLPHVEPYQLAVTRKNYFSIITLPAKKTAGKTPVSKLTVAPAVKRLLDSF